MLLQTLCNWQGSNPHSLLGSLCLSLALGTPTTATRYIDTSCAAFGIITYSSKADTPETIAQVKAHNRAYRVLCPAEAAR